MAGEQRLVAHNAPQRCRHLLRHVFGIHQLQENSLWIVRLAPCQHLQSQANHVSQRGVPHAGFYSRHMLAVSWHLRLLCDTGTHLESNDNKSKCIVEAVVKHGVKRGRSPSSPCNAWFVGGSGFGMVAFAVAIFAAAAAAAAAMTPLLATSAAAATTSFLSCHHFVCGT